MITVVSSSCLWICLLVLFGGVVTLSLGNPVTNNLIGLHVPLNGLLPPIHWGNHTTPFGRAWHSRRPRPWQKTWRKDLLTTPSIFRQDNKVDCKGALILDTTTIVRKTKEALFFRAENPGKKTAQFMNLEWELAISTCWD
mmetsp:Transcript_33796/g.58410  ORF Transcript_33796/g.58410 Transcript_33796/m.58410 type:complete len:140 (-) Transcript_33796:23-442(-)